MESGRSNFITVYDLLGWGGRTLMESGRKKIIMGHKRGCFWGSPYMREEVERGETRARGGREGGEGGTEGQRKSDHGIRPFRVGEGGIHGIMKRKLYHGTRKRGREGGKRDGRQGERGARGGHRVTGILNMGCDPLGWGGGTFMELGRGHFIMGYDALGWGGAFMKSGRWSMFFLTLMGKYLTFET